MWTRRSWRTAGKGLRAEYEEGKREGGDYFVRQVEGASKLLNGHPGPGKDGKVREETVGANSRADWHRRFQ